MRFIPIDRPPHMGRDVSNSIRSAEVKRKRAAAKHGKEDAEGYFHDESDDNGR